MDVNEMFLTILDRKLKTLRCKYRNNNYFNNNNTTQWIGIIQVHTTQSTLLSALVFVCILLRKALLLYTLR